MIQQQTRLDIADNTGAKTAMCIKVLGARRPAEVQAEGGLHRRPDRDRGQDRPAQRRREEGEVARAVIVRTHHPVRRADGSYVRLRQERGGDRRSRRQPRGTRIFGAVARELRRRTT